MRHKQRERGLQTAGRSWRSEGDPRGRGKQTEHTGEMQFKREVRLGQTGKNSGSAEDLEVAPRYLHAELVLWLPAASGGSCSEATL